MLFGRCWRYGLVLTALALLLWPNSAAAERYALTHYSTAQGVAQMGVRVLLQDRHGYLWLGTVAGLNRYDGQRFVTFGPREELPNDHVNALLEDDRGRLWIGTDASVLTSYDQGDWRGHRAPDELLAGGVTALASAGWGERALYCGTARGVVVRRGDHYERLPGGLKRRVHALHTDTSGVLWIATEVGLYRYHHARQPVAAAIEAVGERPVRAVVTAADGTVWAALDGEVVAYRGGTIVDRIRNEGDTPVLDSPLRGLMIDRFGDLWIVAAEGVVHVRERHRRVIGTSTGLSITSAFDILEDREGIVWIAGFGGVSKFLGRAFTTYTTDDGLTGDSVVSLLRDRRGRLWVGSVRGLSVGDRHGFEAVPPPPEVIHHLVWALHEDREGVIRAGFGPTLVRIEDEGVAVEAQWPTDSRITAIATTPDGERWVGVRHVGLHRWAEGRYQPVSVPGNEFTDIRMIVDRRGHLWVSGDRGISHFDGRTWTLLDEDDGLAGPRPYALVEDREGNIWWGYHSSLGVTRYDGEGMVTLTTEDGLANDAVYSVGLAPDGALWVGSARGVDRYAEGRLVNYGRAEGYASSESNAGGFWADDDGTLWFGTAEGLSRYASDRDVSLTDPPALRIAEVRLGGEPHGDGDETSHERNDFTAEAHVLSYSNAEQTEVEHRVLGYRDRWQPLDRGAVDVPNLQPGDYRWEVRARRYGQAWSEPISVGFTILPPWWQTWPFRIGVSLALLSVVAAGMRIRERRMRQTNAHLRALVEERTKSNAALLEADQLKDEFIAKVSHEIRTPLNGIIGMTELSLEAEDDQDKRERLRLIKQSSDSLLELIDDLLDLSQLQQGVLELRSQPFVLRRLVDEALETFAALARKRGIELSCEIGPEVPPRVVGDPVHLRQVLLDLVGNGLKFTERGTVSVSVSRAPSGEDDDFVELRFEVRDTGIGIHPDKQQSIFENFVQADGTSTRRYGGSGLGLAISRRLVEAMGGRISLTSEVGRGSTFEFTVRVREGHSDEAVEPDPEPEFDDATDEPPPDVAVDRALRILVVEDNRINQLVTTRMLGTLGHSTQVADNGRVALERLDDDPSFDVVLMDIQMPEMDGIAATRAIRSLPEPALAKIPIIAVTADARHDSRERFRQAGMDGYVSKPVKRDVLLEAIAGALRASER